MTVTTGVRWQWFGPAALAGTFASLAQQPDLRGPLASIGVTCAMAFGEYAWRRWIAPRLSPAQRAVAVEVAREFCAACGQRLGQTPPSNAAGQ